MMFDRNMVKANVGAIIYGNSFQCFNALYQCSKLPENMKIDNVNKILVS